MTTAPLLSVLEAGVEIIELGQPLFTGMPSSPNHPGFRMTLARRHGDMVRPDGSSAASEVLITGGHVGTHIDALAHVSYRGKLHGGVDAAAAQAGGVFREHGVERVPPLITRGVLLDVAAARDTDCLEPGYGVTEADLEAAARRGGARPRRGDVAVIRTGWAANFADTARYLGHDCGVPGVTVAAARWLADRGVVAAGADTTAFEQIPAGAGHALLPVHRLLLVDKGVYIMEHLNLEPASERSLSEFLFVAAPLRIVGGTGSPIRPLAVVTQ
jgi:kynurenine formamidase